MSDPLCTWCGHASHAAECRLSILTRPGTRSQPAETAPCPCARRDGGRWQDRAACLDAGIHIEFLARPEDEQIEICHGCPVRSECLEYGREVGLSFVVFAGKKPSRWPRMPQREELLTHYTGYGI